MCLGSCYIRPATTVNDIQRQQPAESEQPLAAYINEKERLLALSNEKRQAQGDYFSSEGKWEMTEMHFAHFTPK